VARKTYNPPPDWPAPPEGWRPPKGWKPDPAWGPPPDGWQLWLTEDDHTRTRIRERIASASANAGLASRSKADRAERPDGQRPKPRWLPLVAASVAALLVGIAIGAASNSHSSQVNSLKRHLASSKSDASLARSRADGEQQDIADLKTQLSAATTLAAIAQQKAEQKAQSDYATKLAAVKDRENQVKGREDAVSKREAAVQKAEQGLQATAFDGDGLYLVGRDVQPGVYSTTASDSGNCYIARLSSTNTNDIIDNQNTSGPTTVTIEPTDRAIQVDGCNPFKKIG
jgi:hypothetical protein